MPTLCLDEGDVITGIYHNGRLVGVAKNPEDAKRAEENFIEEKPKEINNV